MIWSHLEMIKFNLSIEYESIFCNTYKRRITSRHYIAINFYIILDPKINILVFFLCIWTKLNHYEILTFLMSLGVMIGLSIYKWKRWGDTIPLFKNITITYDWQHFTKTLMIKTPTGPLTSPSWSSSNPLTSHVIFAFINCSCGYA